VNEDRIGGVDARQLFEGDPGRGPDVSDGTADLEGHRVGEACDLRGGDGRVLGGRPPVGVAHARDEHPVADFEGVDGLPELDDDAGDRRQVDGPVGARAKLRVDRVHARDPHLDE